MIINVLKKNGVSNYSLDDDLRGLKNIGLSMKQICETINGLKVSYGQLRCTSPKLLRDTLGIEWNELVMLGDILNLNNPKSIYDSVLTINVIKDGYCEDFGFFPTKDVVPTSYSTSVIEDTKFFGMV